MDYSFQLTWNMGCEGWSWGGPAFWNPTFGPACEWNWWGRFIIEGGLGCGGNGGCKDIFGKLFVCDGGCCIWVEGAGGIWGGRSDCGCGAEWREGGGTFTIWEGWGSKKGLGWAFKCPLCCWLVCWDCEGVDWVEIFAVGICFLGGIWAWDEISWSCEPSWLGIDGAAWMLGCWGGGADCWGCCCVTGGRIFGIWT